MTDNIDYDEDALTPVNSTPPAPYSRQEVLSLLSGFISELKRRSETGRIRDSAAFKCRISAISAGIHGCSVLLSGLKDIQLDEIEKRLIALEEVKP